MVFAAGLRLRALASIVFFSFSFRFRSCRRRVIREGDSSPPAPPTTTHTISLSRRGKKTGRNLPNESFARVCLRRGQAGCTADECVRPCSDDVLFAAARRGKGGGNKKGMGRMLGKIIPKGAHLGRCGQSRHVCYNRNSAGKVWLPCEAAARPLGHGAGQGAFESWARMGRLAQKRR